jgi:hypothetical protein
MLFKELLAVVSLNKQIKYVFKILGDHLSINALCRPKLFKQQGHFLLLSLTYPFLNSPHLLSDNYEMLEQSINMGDDRLKIDIFAQLKCSNRFSELTTVFHLCGT